MPKSDTVTDAQLNVWRSALAALHGEKARINEKYDRRIAALKKAITHLERSAARASTRPSAKAKKSSKKR